MNLCYYCCCILLVFDIGLTPNLKIKSFRMLKLLSRRLVTRSENLIFQQSAKQCSSAPESKELTAPPNPFEHYDYFGVSKLFTVKTLFDSRMHLGHTVRSLQPQMSPFVFGTRYLFKILNNKHYKILSQV